MEIVGAVGVFVVVLVVAVLFQVGFLVAASGLVASKPLSAGQALVVVIVASLANLVVQFVMSMSGLANFFFSTPMMIIVWGGTISMVGDLRIGESVFTAVAMSILQFLLVFGLLAAMGVVIATLGIGSELLQ